MTAPEFVLLVDDIPDHIYSYATALRARGYAIGIAESGGDAFLAARARRPACIIIDERLSDMRGWDLCAALKREPALAGVPVIVLAQELTFEAARQGQAVGCDAWLARPSVPDDIVRAVGDVVAAKTPTPPTPEDALVGFSTCTACTSPRIRAGVRVGPAQYFMCRDCGLRWRTEAESAATA